MGKKKYTPVEIANFMLYPGEDEEINEFINNISNNGQWGDLYKVLTWLINSGDAPELDDESKVCLGNVCRLSWILDRITNGKSVSVDDLVWLKNYAGWKDDDISDTIDRYEYTKDDLSDKILSMTPEQLTGLAVEAREKADELWMSDKYAEDCELYKQIADIAETVAVIKREQTDKKNDKETVERLKGLIGF